MIPPSQFLNIQKYIHTRFSNIFLKFISWIRYNFCLCKAAAFVSGLIFTHKLVDFTVAMPLITYFSDDSRKNKYIFRKAAMFMSIKEGLSASLVTFAAWISYSFVRPLTVMIFSTASYTIALFLFYLIVLESEQIPKSKIDLCNLIAMILLAVGEAGLKPHIEAFLTDQIRAHGGREVDNEDQVMAQEKVWWRLAWCCSAVVAYFLFNFEWLRTFFYNGLLMGISFILLVSGITSYHSKESTFNSSPFSVFRVVKNSVRNRNLTYPSSADQFFRNDNRNQLNLSPRVKFFRWLDKAAIIESSSSFSPEDQEKAGKVCTVAQVRESKLLLKMFPMFTSFLVFGMVSSAGDTFLPEQATNMQSEEFMIFLLLSKHIFSGTTSYLSDKFISQMVPKSKQGQAQIVRILIGMVLSTFYCAVAWRVEVHRLILVRKEGLLDMPEEALPMSIIWLVPQFFLLGLMEGLAKDGLDEFVSYHFPEWTGEHVSAISKFLIGIGSFLNIVCITANKSLLGKTLNRSRLDKYYQMLAILANVNMCYNWYLSIFYMRSVQNDVDKAHALSRPSEQLGPQPDTKSSPWNFSHDNIPVDELVNDVFLADDTMSPSDSLP